MNKNWEPIDISPNVMQLGEDTCNQLLKLLEHQFISPEKYPLVVTLVRELQKSRKFTEVKEIY